MIIVKTPFRMSFFGGGTDMPDFFNEYGGSVISTSFDKYCYVNVKHLPRFFEYSNELFYSRIERVNDYQDFEHPAVRNAMQMLKMDKLRITYEADLPARTGLGTSSSFAVGMLQAFHSLKGEFVSKEKLAKEAIYLERELCNEAGGWQDQVAASFGGLNRINFRDNSIEVSPIIISPEKKLRLNKNLMLFFTGFTRFSADIQKAKNYKNKTQELLEMRDLVDQAETILENKNADLDDFGRLLNETWQIKRGISERVSTDSIDELYKIALQNGAIGGKLLGAGGGGFLLFYVPQEKKAQVRSALSDLMYVPFLFEDSGTQVIHYSPEDFDGEENHNGFK